ncbi:hypothetical protein [Nocardia asteroides]|uniref:hypothetical protein n=1 Tax=Nocardia asteroides TaxID=1824 RepID=UPI001E376789|nr:hypothetical protein [Nocardia asteroides]UGT59998.1 hypothetical protein LTT61_22615 [Nocardia asteroides]
MTTPWDSFHSQAGAGVLKLEPGVLEGLVNAANGARVRVSTVRGQVSKVDNLSPFAAVLASAEMLARRFSAKGQELGRILDDHVEILDDLNETFMAAARAYVNSEEAGTADFERLRQWIDDHRDPGLRDTLSQRPPPADLSTANDHYNPGGAAPTPVPGWNEVGSQGEEGHWGLPADLQSPRGVQFDPQAGLHPEEFEPISYEQYQTIIASITQGAPVPPLAAAQAAADWRWLSGELRSSFNILTTQMAGTQSSWTSTDSNGAAERARQAIQAYGTGVDTLLSSMNAVGSALEYVSEWLHTTGVELLQVNDSLPTTGNPGETVVQFDQRRKEQAHTGYVRVMNKDYGPGIEHTAQVIAVLPPAIAPTTGQQPQVPGGPGGNSGGGGGGGGGGGVPGGGGGPNPGQQQLAGMQDRLLPTAEEIAQLEQGQGQGQGDGTGQGDGQGQNGLTPEQQRALAGQQGAQGGAPGAQAAQQLGQQLAQFGQQAGQQLGQLGQQLGQLEQLGQLGQLGGLPGGVPAIPALSELSEQVKRAGKGGGGAGGGVGGGGGGVGGGVGGERPALQNLDKASKLFPRAAPAAEFTATRAGIAPGAGTPMSGMPMGGAGGAQGGGQQKDHKRADYLDSSEHLEEAFGEAPVVVRPIVEQ